MAVLKAAEDCRTPKAGACLLLPPKFAKRLGVRQPAGALDFNSAPLSFICRSS